MTKKDRDQLKKIVARHEAAGDEVRVVFCEPKTPGDAAMENSWADIEFLLGLVSKK